MQSSEDVHRRFGVFSPSQQCFLSLNVTISFPSVPMLTAHISAEISLALTEDFSLVSIEFNPTRLYEIPLPVRLKSISVCRAAGLLLSDIGQVFSIGVDSLQEGILGIPGEYSLAEPTLIPELQGVHTVNMSISATHSASLDKDGKLYTWGSSTQGELGTRSRVISNLPPTLIDISHLFTASSVVCGDTYTCMCTHGGSVYVYGHIGSAHKHYKDLLFPFRKSTNKLFLRKDQGNVPYTVPEMEKFFAVSVGAGAGFIAFLEESGDVYVFDACLDLIKLPTEANVNIKKFTVCGD